MKNELYEGNGNPVLISKTTPGESCTISLPFGDEFIGNVMFGEYGYALNASLGAPKQQSDETQFVIPNKNIGGNAMIYNMMGGEDTYTTKPHNINSSIVCVFNSDAPLTTTKTGASTYYIVDKTSKQVINDSQLQNNAIVTSFNPNDAKEEIEFMRHYHNNDNTKILKVLSVNKAQSYYDTTGQYGSKIISTTTKIGWTWSTDDDDLDEKYLNTMVLTIPYISNLTINNVYLYMQSVNDNKSYTLTSSALNNPSPETPEPYKFKINLPTNAAWSYQFLRKNELEWYLWVQYTYTSGPARFQIYQISDFHKP